MNNKFNTNKFGIICSVFQVVLSAVCLIYNIISKADYIIWIIMI